MSKKITQKVYVAFRRWADRHGDSGANLLGVFDSKRKADDAARADKEAYLREFDAIDRDGNFDPDMVNSVDDGDPSTLTLDDVLSAYDIGIDGEGTWCEWDVSAQDVQ